MTLIKLKDILLERAITNDAMRNSLQRTIEQSAGGTNVTKKYVTKKAKELNSEFKGKPLFKEYKIKQIMHFGGQEDQAILIGIAGEGGGGIIPIKLHVYGKAWKADKSTGKFSFNEKGWKIGQYLETDPRTKNTLVEMLKMTFGTSIVDAEQGTKAGQTIEWDAKDIEFVTPAGEKSLNDFTGEGSGDEDGSGAGGGVQGGQVRKKDFERLSQDDIMNQIAHWADINGAGAFRELQNKIRNKKI